MNMTTPASPPPHPDLQRTLDRLESFARTLAGSSAVISRDDLNGGRILTLHVEPSNPRARAIAVVCEQFLIVQIGTNGGRWELGYGDDDIVIAQNLIKAAIAGRVSERFAAGRSRVDVTFEDGTTVSETGVTSWEAPFFRRRGRTSWDREVHYEPYGEHGVDS